MKLKALFFTLALVITANITANAQEGSTYNEEDCGKYRSLYYQYLKQDMVRDACNFWAMAVSSCGDSLDGKFFKNGRVAYLKLEKTIDEKDEAALKGVQDTLVWIFEKRMEIEKDPDWELDYAVMLVTNKSEDFEKMDKLFKNIHVLKENSSPTQMRYYFMHLILNKFNKASAEEKEAARELVIEEYIVLSDYCKAAIKAAEGIADEKKRAKQIEYYEGTQDFLDKYFLKIAQDCSVLTPVLDKKFETIPAGEAGMPDLNKFIGLMERQKCTESETYEKYVIEANKRNPTAAGYYGLGNIYNNKKDYTKAIEAFQKAIEMEGDGENKDAYTLELAQAQYKAHQYNAAFRTAKSVGGKYQGKGLVICGNCIAALANSCGESTFERKANYWLANDYYRRAAGMGEDVSSSQFLSSAPDSGEIFDNSYTVGSSITLSCWGESTTIR